MVAWKRYNNSNSSKGLMVSLLLLVYSASFLTGSMIRVHAFLGSKALRPSYLLSSISSSSRFASLNQRSFSQNHVKNRLFHRSISSSACQAVQNHISDNVSQPKLGIKATRKLKKEAAKQRNLKLKKLLNNKDEAYQIPPLFAVKVSVCKELREELKMNGREKRGRVFIELDSDGCKTLKGLKMELHSFFRTLRKSTYTLSFALPEGMCA